MTKIEELKTYINRSMGSGFFDEDPKLKLIIDILLEQQERIEVLERDQKIPSFLR